MKKAHLSTLLAAAFSALLLASSAQAQTNVVINGTVGTNSITNNYSTDGGLNLSLGFFADYLVLGGGGGGGGATSSLRGAGGGGAGGLLQGITNLVSSNYSVVVGAGGAGGANNSTNSLRQGQSGSNSVFGALTAVGGGGGGAGGNDSQFTGTSGGSGGGAGGGGNNSMAGASGGTGATGQGTSGGASVNNTSSNTNGASANRWAGGGGGGAGSAGTSGDQAPGNSGFAEGGDGGSGATSTITGSSVTYAGGGGGGAVATATLGSPTNTAGTGGAGGGGNGGAGNSGSSGVNGVNGLGGGGGGAASSGTGGTGGSGAVIVRYQGASLGNIGGTITAGTGSAAGYTIHTFTNTGSANFNMSGVDLNARLGATLNGAITGSGNLTLSGPGTITLGASNSYTGTTTILSNTVRLANAGTFGSGAVTNNSAVILARSDNFELANAITGTGSLTQQGSGTVVLSGNNDYSGTTTVSAGTVILSGSNSGSGNTAVNAGTLQVGNGATTGSLGSGAVSVATNATIAFNRSDNIEFGTALTGAGRLSQIGSGTLTLTGANGNTGGTVISSGALRVGNGGTSGQLGGGSVAISNGAALVFNRNDNVALDNTVSGAGLLRQSGSGTLTVTANSTHSGGTVIDSARALQIGAGGGSGSLGSGAVTNNGTLIYNRSGLTTLANNISGTGSLDVTTTASFTTLSGSNSYSGSTRVRGTEITIGQNALAGSTLTTFTNDRTTTLEVKALNGNPTCNIGGLAGDRNVNLNSTLRTLNVGANNESTLFSGTLTMSGPGDLNKFGTGTLSLSGNGNSVASGINVRSGAVEVAGGSTTVASRVRVGQENGDQAALHVSGGTLVGGITLGTRAGATGTATMTGGTISDPQGYGLEVGNQGTGTFTLNGGTVNTSYVWVAGTGSKGTLNISGGSLMASGGILQGYGGSSSTLNLSGGQIISSGTAGFGLGTNSTTTLNISGGTFEHRGPYVYFISSQAGDAQFTLNLTGNGVFSATNAFIDGGAYNRASTITLNLGTGGDAGALITKGMTLGASNATINFNHTNSGYILGGGFIRGASLAVNHNGPGTSILTGSDLDWRGGTTINNGTLQIGNGGSVNAFFGLFGITNNSTLAFNFSNNTSILGVVTGTGALVKGGTGTLNLRGVNTYNGGTVINGGTLATGGANSLLASSAVTVNTNGTLSLGGAQTLAAVTGTGSINLGTNRLTVGASNSEFAGRISGAGGVTKAGEGIFTLSGSNSYKGDTIVDAGTLVLGGSNSLGSASVVKVNTGGTLQASQRVVVGFVDLNGGSIVGSNNLVSALTLINSGSVSGLANGTDYAAGILKRTAGVATVDGANSFTGTTKIEAGTVQLVQGGSFAAGSSLFLQGGAAMDLNGFSQTFSEVDGAAGSVSLGSGNLTVGGSGNSDFGGVISGSGKLIKSGLGTMTLTAAQSYSGGTEVTGGRLVGNTTSLTGAIANSATVEFVENGSSSLGAAVTGSGVLVKSGLGTLTVAGAQAYTGTTSVYAGELKVNGSLAGAVGVQAAASLSGSGTVGAISGAGAINPGNSPGILTAPSVDPSGGLTFNLEFTSINPVFSDAAASVNDLLRLTSGTPFTASLTSANTVNIYFNVGSFGAEQTYTGGFFTDTQSDFLSEIAGATFNYYVAAEGGGVVYNGVNYTLVDASLDIVVTTTAQNGADFAGGAVNGQIAQFEVVPEPSTYALLVLAAAGFGANVLRRRRK